MASEQMTSKKFPTLMQLYIYLYRERETAQVDTSYKLFVYHFFFV